MRLVRVEYESGGEEFESVEVYDRKEWLTEHERDEVWRLCAQQATDDLDVGEMDGKRLVALELFGWWVDSEASDADRTDTTWRGSYGRVYGKDLVVAVVDAEWSRGKAAWSFPHIRTEDGRWRSPGKYGPGGPKSVMPVIFPVGTPRKIDAVEVRKREAKQAAYQNDLEREFDWETAIEKARKRYEKRASWEDEELDISPIKSLEDQHRAAHIAANKGFVRFCKRLKEELGTDVDPVTMSVANEAIAHAVRDLEDLDDPRE